MPPNISAYIRGLQSELATGKATEHTYRPALKALVESVQSGILATNEPSRVQCGAPDFIVQKRGIPLGYIECKDIGERLDDVEKTEQVQRYLTSLANFILTDYLEFRYYVQAEWKMTVRVGRIGDKGKIRPDALADGSVIHLLEMFASAVLPAVSTPKDLARRMARLALLVRDTILNAFTTEPRDGKLHQQMEGFREVLLHDLTKEQFADMYAQTISYGLFAARCNISDKDAGKFSRQHAAFDLPKTNPFLRTMFTHMAGPDLDERITWAVDDLAELLRRTDIGSILADFGKATKREDPVVHFYETFLSEYDPKMRESRGVYYTPEPVVSYIVRSVDEILKADFGIEAGLADASTIRRPVENPDTGKTELKDVHKVQILDPAVGTGTFLYSVINHIHEAFRDDMGLWSSYVSAHLLPRLFGFELLMAPYAVAHMKLGIQFKDTGYDFSGSERLNVFLTNTLEEAQKYSEGLFAALVAREANEASKVKKDVPVMVVLGNPPYSGHSANKGKWIRSLIDDYRRCDGAPLGERNPKWINDDYVKFIRFAQWRIERTGYGILAFISNNGYLDNPTFRGMRQSLMNTFDDIYVLDLHGNSKKKETCPDGSKDENVFDITQGVNIGIFVRRPARSKTANVHHADCYGNRRAKYRWLLGHDRRRTKWKRLAPRKPYYLFLPQDVSLLAEYEHGWKITEAMPVNVLGFQSHRDHFAVDFDRESLRTRIAEMLDPHMTDRDYADRYGLVENAGWQVSKARRQLRRVADWERQVTPCLYRPFDLRFCCLSEVAMDRPRRELLDHVADRENLCLNVVRQTKMPTWQHAVVSDVPTPAVFVELKDGSSVFPLYLYPNGDFPETLFDYDNGRRPNLALRFVDDIAKRVKLSFAADGKGDLKKTFGPEDVFHYLYAVFHAPIYRSRYAQFLKMDFPRVPLTSSLPLFRKLCGLGGKLVKLHLFKSKKVFTKMFPVRGSDTVEEVRYGVGRVWINKDQYFDNVPEGAWQFHIGGYQVCEKWLKDRRGRKLTHEDLTHYENIVLALCETIRLRISIDSEIAEHGGWPDAFRGEQSSE